MNSFAEMLNLTNKEDISEKVQNLGSMLNDGASMIKLYPVLKEVTSSVDQPPPGYLYQILIDFSFKSQKNAELLGDYLTRRLNRQNPYGVLKTLKTIQHVSSKGSRNFRAYVRSHDDNLRNLTSRMPSKSPGEGSVREQILVLTDNLLSELFNQANIDKDSIPESETLPGQNCRMTGMGSLSNSSSSQGFGNTGTSTGSASVAASLLNVVHKIVSAPDPKLERLEACLQPTSVGNYTPAKLNVPSTDFSSLGSTSNSANNRKYVKGRAGGGWESSDDESEDDLSQFCRMYAASTPTERENAGNTDNYQLISECQEFNIIHQFCCKNPSENQNFVNYDQLQEVLQKLQSSGNKTVILQSLQYILTTESENNLLRCLCVIEQVMQTWLLSAAVILAALRVPLESRRLDPDPTIAVKSSKILSTLEFLKNYKS